MSNRATDGIENQESGIGRRLLAYSPSRSLALSLSRSLALSPSRLLAFSLSRLLPDQRVPVPVEAVLGHAVVNAEGIAGPLYQVIAYHLAVLATFPQSQIA